MGQPDGTLSVTTVFDVTLRGTARMGTEYLFPPIEFTLRAGRWTCLLGPSGGGKTTLLRLLAGVETSAVLDGVIDCTDHQPLHGRLAFMTQSDLLFPWASVLDNVCLGASLRREAVDKARARALLARVGLEGYDARKPHQLSGGQRQRVSLARTLMENRPVVLLDEPFCALDARTRTEMQTLTAELLDGRTVLLVTHDPAEAARLGQDVAILTHAGLQKIATPTAPTPRAPDAPDSLAFQGALYRLLMRDAEAGEQQ